MIFKSKLRLKAERLYSDKIYRRHDINKARRKLDISELENNVLINEDNKLRIEINLLGELLR